MTKWICIILIFVIVRIIIKEIPEIIKLNQNTLAIFNMPWTMYQRNALVSPTVGNSVKSGTIVEPVFSKHDICLYIFNDWSMTLQLFCWLYSVLHEDVKHAHM